jgi:hypothetical protein
MTARERGVGLAAHVDAQAIGITPTTVVRLVMMMGRSRVRPARITASCNPSPWRLSSLM